MAKGVLDTRGGSGYDDDIVERYHFPNRYLAIAQRLVGDWIVYREPRRNGGRFGYVASARVTRIDADPNLPGHSFARIGDYLPFDAVVPLDGPGGAYEETLRAVGAPARRGVALQGRSIRTIAEGDFATILLAGLRETLSPANAVRLELDRLNVSEADLALVEAPLVEQERRVSQILLSRKIRDANFRRQVCDAYGDRCAVTRLRIVNGGGKSEVQAAHIWPARDGGPDVVQNGLALSATAHWLFDRHLISLTDDYGLLVSHNKVPAELRSLFEGQLRRVHLPDDERLWPHPAYVTRHREAYLSSWGE